MGIPHVCNTDFVRELVSTNSNLTPDDLLAGKWVLVDMAPSEWGDIGLFMGACWKYLVHRAVLRRVARPDSNIVTTWADESHQFVSSFDAHFITLCRSHRGCQVFLSQSLSYFYAALSGEKGRHQADSLLAGFPPRHWPSWPFPRHPGRAESCDLKALQTFTGGSTTPPDSSFNELMGGSRYSGNYSQHYESMLQANGFLCDCFVIRRGEPFSGDENYLAASFNLGPIRDSSGRKTCPIQLTAEVAARK